MGETCVIRLDSTADGATWVTVDDTGAPLGPPRAGTLAEAAPDARGRRVIGLLPGGLVLRTTAEVPVKGGTRLAQALPFALEDTLADDVEDLHFAPGRRQDDGSVTVAVIRRQLLEERLGALRAAGIEPAVLAADSDALLEVPATTTVLLEPTQVLLREPGLDPVMADPEGLQGLLELWLAQARPPAAEGALPPARNLLIYDATAGAVPQDLWDALRPRVQSLEVRLLAEGALPRLAAGAVAGPLVNLLQGDFGPRTSLAAQWPRWRTAAALAAGLVLVLTGSLAAELLSLRRESATLAGNIDQALRYTFPDVTDTSNPRAILRERTAQGPGAAAGGGPPFLDSLRTVAQALASTQDARLEAINFRSGVIELQVRAPNAEALDRIRQQVTEGGTLNAEIQSANASGDQVLGRLRITGAGA